MKTGRGSGGAALAVLLVAAVALLMGGGSHARRTADISFIDEGVHVAEDGTTPQHIHIAYGETADTMSIVWSTAEDSSSLVRYGTSAASLDKVVSGQTVLFTKGNPSGLHYIHRVKLMHLDYGRTYYYLVQSDSSRSSVYNFTTMKESSNWEARLLVFGDMGRHGGPQALPSLIEEVQKGWPHAIIHAGDFAYDLHSDGGLTGDEFMEQIQPLAATVPYMTCIGNHEDDFDYSHYINRFYMPNFEDSQNMWYSWDMGKAHFVAYSTEVFFQPSDKYTPQRQYQWLVKDLTKANLNREERPWIIVFGHRPMYCSNENHDDCTKYNSTVRNNLESLFYDQGVDLIIEAHEHSYERLWPVYKEKVIQHNYIRPRAPVHIISGAAGCNEQDGVCVNPIKTPGGPWSAFRSSGNTTYGYGRMIIYNDTHLYWEELQAVLDDRVLDSIWVVQDQHGTSFGSASMKLSPLNELTRLKD
ncbi:Purple acid phosphatase [Balamuthia mandrillaris]